MSEPKLNLESTTKIMKPITVTFTDFEDFETKAGLLHGRRISRGLRIQKSIYDNIKNSNKHLDVKLEYKIEYKIQKLSKHLSISEI